MFEFTYLVRILIAIGLAISTRFTVVRGVMVY
jgi:hypothetical protein